jgi:hypothetical protein
MTQTLTLDIPDWVISQVHTIDIMVIKEGQGLYITETQKESILRVIEWMEGTLQSYRLLYDSVGLQTIPSVITEWENIISDLRMMLQGQT